MAKAKTKKSARPATRPAARKPSAKKPVAAATIKLPVLAKGEIYAGILLRDGKPAHHLVLLPIHKIEPVKWENAMAWAKAQGGELPTRKEQALLFANAAEHFTSDWYWSQEVHPVGADFAFIQYFGGGGQHYGGKDNSYRARAVRRVAI